MDVLNRGNILKCLATQRGFYRSALERLEQLRVPEGWQEEIKVSE